MAQSRRHAQGQLAEGARSTGSVEPEARRPRRRAARACDCTRASGSAASRAAAAACRARRPARARSTWARRVVARRLLLRRPPRRAACPPRRGPRPRSTCPARRARRRGSGGPRARFARRRRASSGWPGVTGAPSAGSVRVPSAATATAMSMLAAPRSMRLHGLDLRRVAAHRGEPRVAPGEAVRADLAVLRRRVAERRRRRGACGTCGTRPRRWARRCGPRGSPRRPTAATARARPGPTRCAGLPVSGERNERWHEPHIAAVRSGGIAIRALCVAQARVVAVARDGDGRRRERVAAVAVGPHALDAVADAARDAAVRARIGRRDLAAHRAVDQQRHVVAPGAEAARVVADVRAEAVDGDAVDGVVEARRTRARSTATRRRRRRGTRRSSRSR